MSYVHSAPRARPLVVLALTTAFAACFASAAPLRMTNGFTDHRLPCPGRTYKDWAYSRTFLLNTTATGAGVDRTVKGFPVCLRLSLAALDFSQAQARGQDLRFSTAEGWPLSYQIERWDSAAGTATVWVKVDVPGDAVTGLVIYWGNPNAQPASNAQAVFGHCNGFAGVWHLAESPADGQYGHLDATGNGNNAEPLNFADSWLGRTGTEGLLDGADLLDTLNDWLVVRDNDALDPGEELTLSAWVRVRDAAAMDSAGVIMMHRNRQCRGLPPYSYLFEIGPDMRPSFRWGSVNGRTYGCEAAAAVPEDRWCYVAATRKARALRLYVNGQESTSWAQGRLAGC